MALRHTAAAVLLLLPACSPTHERPQLDPVDGRSLQNQGYSLLLGLVSKQKDVDKLLLIKMEKPDVNSLVKEIAVNCKAAADQLEEFGKQDAWLDMKLTPLPRVEEKTRESIQGHRSKKLLLSSGTEFELELLMSQKEGLSYGAHLARVIAEDETVPERKEFLERMAEDFEALGDRVFRLILSRCAAPDPSD